MKRHASYHFIGIGGIGMSAIAQMLARKGFLVTGSDVEENAMTRALNQQGIAVHVGHHAKNIGTAECIVYSSSIREDNPEIQEAKRRGLAVHHRSEALAFLSQGQWTAAVSGTHGKTTTTAMLGRIFQEEGRMPTVIVGAKVPELGGNAVMGSGGMMVLEADESDSSFLAYEPDAIIVTNIDRDHMDHFLDLDEIYNTFLGFTRQLKSGGKWYGCTECPQTRKLLKEAGGIGYGFSEDARYLAAQVELTAGGSRYTVWGPTGVLGELRLGVPGVHNVLNSLGAAALALESGCSWSAVAKALESFRGASRRFDIRFKGKDFILVDDYAHHPAEIRVTLNAARSFKPSKLTAVFQPHRYSRTLALADEFATAFNDADEVIITDVYAASESPIAGVSGELLARQIRDARGGEVRYVPRDRLHQELKKAVHLKGILLCMGAGDIGRLCEELKDAYTHELV
jgi:UDP-N-acetylmuramate--alanine ligase